MKCATLQVGVLCSRIQLESTERLDFPGPAQLSVTCSTEFQ